jgi:hypothetical protein
MLVQLVVVSAVDTWYLSYKTLVPGFVSDVVIRRRATGFSSHLVILCLC